jgi:hypothetical protein
VTERAGRKTGPGSTRILETKGRMQHRDPNPSNRVTPPGVEATREAILAGTCPFCGKTGFKRIASHTYQAHGIDRMELRAMGGFVLKDSICDDSVSDACRKRTVARQESGNLWRGNPLMGTHELGPEGKRRIAERNRRRGDRVRADYEQNPERCRVCGAAISWDKHRRANRPVATCSEPCYRQLVAQRATKRARLAGKPGKDRPPKSCKVCQRSFVPSDYRVGTCSPECRTVVMASQAQKRRKGPGVCKMCSGPVERKNGAVPAKTCSPECLRQLFAERDARRRTARGVCKICGQQIPNSAAPTAKTCGGSACLSINAVLSGKASAEHRARARR